MHFLRLKSLSKYMPTVHPQASSSYFKLSDLLYPLVAYNPWVLVNNSIVIDHSLGLITLKYHISFLKAKPHAQ